MRSEGTGPSGRVYSAEAEMINVTSYLPRLDPAWQWTDAHGHEHTATGLEDTSQLYVIGEWYCEDCHETHYDYEQFCKLCLAAGVDTVVTPGLVGPSSFREFIPGMTSYAADGEPVTEERFRELLAEEGVTWET